MNFLKNNNIKNIFKMNKFSILNQIRNTKTLINYNKFYMVQINILEDKIKQKINCEKLEIEDISGNCGTSFSIKLKSPDFKGKSMIMQHRMVNDALKDELKDIHALQIKSEVAK